MWSAAIAVQLRRRGHDVVAVLERSDLRGQSDAVVFSLAQVEERAIVTENVIDYRPIAAAELQRNRTHCGVLFTTNRGFPRHDPRTTGRLVTALDNLLRSMPDATNQEYWLG